MKVLLFCLLACTAAGAAAGLLILLLKKFLRDKLSPQWHCYVWLLMMVLLLVPVLVKPELPQLKLPEFPQVAPIHVEQEKADEILKTPPSPSAPPVTMVEPSTLPTYEDLEEIFYQQMDIETYWMEAAPSPLPEQSEYEPIRPLPIEEESALTTKLIFPDWGWNLLLVLWLGGTVILLTKQWLDYRCFSKALRENSYEADDEDELILREVEQELGIRRPVKLAVTALPVSPMLVGLWKPTLYLPDESLNPRQLSLIFIHELTHYRYHDLFYKELALLLRGIHWFNPLTYYMVEDIDFSCELCCDSRVRRHIGSDNAKEYSALLLELLRHERIHAPVASFSMDKSSLKRRLSLIMKPKNTSRVLACLLSVLIAFGGVACSSTVAPELEDVKEEVSKTETTELTTTPDVEENVEESKEEFPYKAAWVSDGEIYSLDRYLAVNQKAQAWIDACDAADDRAFVIAERLEEDGEVYIQYLIYDKEMRTNSYYRDAELDGQGIHLDVSQSMGTNYPQGILFVRIGIEEGKAPSEAPPMNYSVNMNPVALSKIDNHNNFEKDVLLGQDEANRSWSRYRNSRDSALKGTSNHAVHTVEEYLSVVPEAREWVEAQLASDNEEMRALVSKSGEGKETTFCWLIFDPKVRVGSIGGTVGGNSLVYDEEMRAVYYHRRANEDKSAPIALQTMTIRDVQTEEPPYTGFWVEGENGRERVFYEAEKTDINLNYHNRAEILPWTPVEGGTVAAIFSNGERKHEGLDIQADIGTIVSATEAGTVTFADFDGSNGNKVVIDHGNGWSSIYTHCDSINVKVGDGVLQKQQIATVGMSGNATGPHLHFELRKDDVAVDPLIYFHEMAYGMYQSMKTQLIRESLSIQMGDQSKTWGSEDMDFILEVEDKVAGDFLDEICQPKNAHYLKRTVGIDAYPQLQGQGDHVKLTYRNFSLFGVLPNGKVEYKDIVIFVDPENEKDAIVAWQRVDDESQWDIYSVPKHGSYARNIIAMIAPEVEVSVLSDLVQDYQRIVNPDVVGWLSIPNLGINEAVVQAADNEIYTRQNINKEYDVDGALMVDFECDLNGAINSRNTIIYGQNNNNRTVPLRKNEGSFKRFEKLATLTYEDVAKRVPYIYFATPDTESVWEIFAVVETGNEWDSWFFPEIDQSVIDYAKEHSLYDYPVAVNSKDKVLTLSTLLPNDEDGKPQRMVVMAVQMNGRAPARLSAF